MLFLLFIYYLVQWTSINASPVPSVDNHSLAVTYCTDHSHCRSIWNIVWSCLVTIFSCTWVAIHPNVPSPKKREGHSWIEICIWNPLMSFAKHCLPLFVCALLVPEYMLAWAIGQFFNVQEIAERNKGELETLGSVSIIDRSTLVTNAWILYYHGRFSFLRAWLPRDE